ncbi:MAG: chemotaxis protein CheB [Candidatus Saccharimonadales bacterium]
MKKRSPQPSDIQKKQVAFPIVGVGASAGGLETFTQFLRSLPLTTGMAFVLVQHLDPKHKSSLSDLLTKATALPVHDIEDGVKLQPNCVYVIPTNRDLTISEGVLRLHKREQTKQPTHPIDRFFISLAQDQQLNAIGVVFSGGDGDGSKGLQAIKAAGGVCFAQDQTAAFPSMPESAIATGVVDFILSPEGIAKALGRISNQLPVSSTSLIQAQPGQSEDAEQLQEILSLLRLQTGTDLSQYKTTTLKRRISRRLIVNNLDSLSAYITCLENNRPEADALLKDMLINVTSFFRDPSALAELQRTVLPALVINHPDDKPLRVWVAGCANGEEAYSLAIIIQEFLGKRSLSIPVQVFATDLSGAAIAEARRGQYTAETVSKVSQQRLKQFFIHQGENYQIVQSIRDMCVFAPHNLVADPPFSGLDIVSCCNVLIYLQPALQLRLLRTFHYALKPAGYLILGTSETVGSSRTLFSPVDKKHKIYHRKDGVTPLQLERPYPAQPGNSSDTIKPLNEVTNGETEVGRAVDRLLLSRYVPASVVVDLDLEIIQFRGVTSPYLQPASGRASLNLLKMASPSLSHALRRAVNNVQKNHMPYKKDGLVIKDGDTVREVAIEVMPLPAISQGHLLVIFTDTATASAVQAAAVSTTGHSSKALVTSVKDQRISTLEQEAEAAQVEVKRLAEEQEAYNEELQSSNEEIRSSNEELQTLNEELETSGEELQSTNEELQTLNRELRTINEQINAARNYIDAITQTVRDPFVVLGTDLRVVSANDNFYKMFKVAKKDTAGKLIYEIGNNQWDIPELRELLEKILPERTVFNDFEVTHDFPGIGLKNMLLNARQIDHDQLILLAIEDITERQEAAQDLQNRTDSLRFMAESMPQKVFTAEPNGDIDYFNPQWSEYTGLPFNQIKAWGWTQLVHPDDVDENVKQWQQSIDSGEPFYLEHRLRRADGEYRWHLNRAQPMRDEHHKIIKWMGSDTDIDDLKHGEEIKIRLDLLTKQRNALIKLNNLKSEFAALASHQLRTPATAVKQYISLLMDEYVGEVSAEQLQYLQIAYDSNERQLTIINDLLKTVQLESNDFKLNKSQQNIVELVSEVITQLEPIFELRKQTVILDTDKQSISATVDPLEMKLAITNLIENASKYTFPGKGITVLVKEKNHKIQISVRDEGVGITKADISRIFDKFTRVNNELSDTVSGSGLGLYWVKKIVKIHKGTVEVVSAPNKGSTFKISLPQ